MPSKKGEREELVSDIRHLLERLQAKDKDHELLRWEQHFFSCETVRALATAQTQFPGRFKKDGVETLNEALVEYMAEIEDAILDLDAEKEGETADSSTEDAPLELV